MKCLIVGASGFVGSVLSKYLQLHSSITIYGMTRAHEHPTIQHQQLLSYSAQSDREFDAVVYLADDVTGIKAGNIGAIAGGRVRLELALSLVKPTGHFIYYSSRLVYGDSDFGDDKLSPFELSLPSDDYGAHKVECERLVSLANIRHKTILRPTNIYGTINHTGYSLIDMVMDGCMNRKGVTLHGSGFAKRDYVSILDVVNFTKILIENPSAAGTYNVSSGASLHAFEIKEIAKRQLKCRLEYTFVSPEKHFPDFHASSNKMGQILKSLGVTVNSDSSSFVDKYLVKEGWS